MLVRNYFNTIQKVVWVEPQHYCFQINPRYFRNLSQPKVKIFELKMFWNISKICVRRNSTILVRKFLRLFQKLSELQLNNNASKILQDISKTFSSGGSTLLLQNYSRTIWKNNLVAIQHYCFKNSVRKLRNKSWLGSNSTLLFQNYSRTFREVF